MNLRALVGLALAYLWQRKLRSFLTILGVIIGVGALTLLVGFGLGIDRAFATQKLSDDVMSIMYVFPEEEDPPGRTADEKRERTVLDRNSIEKIRNITGVAEAWPHVEFVAQISFGGVTSSELRVVGMPPYPTYEPVRKLLWSGDLFRSESANEVIIHEHLHSRLIKDTGQTSLLGKTVRLKYKRQSAIGEEKEGEDAGGDWGELDLKVVGILADTGNEQKRIGWSLVGPELAIIPPAIAQRLYDDERVIGVPYNIAVWANKPRNYDRIDLRLSGVEQADAVKQQLDGMNLRFFYIPDSFAIIRQLFLIFSVILAVISGISLVVAALGIINTLVMSVLERTREIGIMRAIGASNGEVWRLIMLEGALIGFLGGLVGFLISLGLGSIIDLIIRQFLPKDQEMAGFFHFPMWFFGGTIGFATFMSWAASLYPAWRAVRVDPVEALRRE